MSINVLDPDLHLKHPTLVPWVNGMRMSGRYTDQQIQEEYDKQQQEKQNPKLNQHEVCQQFQTNSSTKKRSKRKKKDSHKKRKRSKHQSSMDESHQSRSSKRQKTSHSKYDDDTPPKSRRKSPSRKRKIYDETDDDDEDDDDEYDDDEEEEQQQRNNYINSNNKVKAEPPRPPQPSSIGSSNGNGYSQSPVTVSLDDMIVGAIQNKKRMDELQQENKKLKIENIAKDIKIKELQMKLSQYQYNHQ